MSTNKKESNYIVEKTLKYSEFLKYEHRLSYEKKYYETDVFKKASRTTVCFRGAFGAKVMYCENCNETHYDNMEIIMELRDYSSYNEQIEDNSPIFGRFTKGKEAHISKVICKKCGSSYNLEDIRIIEHYRYAQDSSIRAVYDTIYNENGLVKLSMKVCSMVAERAFYSVDNRYKIIFNTKTGQTYLYNNPANKKNKVKPLDCGNMTLSNINFASKQFDSLFQRCLFDHENPEIYKIEKLKEFYGILYENISNNLGYKPKTLEEYAKEFGYFRDKDIYSFKIFALYNRFPNLNPFGVLSICPEYTSKISVLKKITKIKNTSKEPLLELANLYNVTDYDLFSKYFYNSEGDKIYWLIYFSMFFKDSEYLYNLSEKFNLFPGIASTPEQLDEKCKKRYSFSNSSTLFFRDIKKVMNEDNLYKIFKLYIESTDVNYQLNNIADLYYAFNTINNKFKLNIQKIANLLCRIIDDKNNMDKVATNIENFIYTEFNEYNYNKQKKNFKFKLNTIDDYYLNVSTHVNRNSILASKLYQEIPYFNPYILTEMFFNEERSLGIRNQHSHAKSFNIFNYVDSQSNLDVLKSIFEKFNVPNVKSFRSRILKKPSLFAALVFYSQIFKDVNLINNILDNLKTKRHFTFTLDSVVWYFEGSDASKRSTLAGIHNLAKCLADNFGETIAAKKIATAYLNNQMNELEDIWSMYELHSQFYPDTPIDLTGNIKEIHDRLIGLTGGARTPFTEDDLKPIIYTKAEKELEFNSDKYSFNLAYDGRELALIGNELKNCVRGYSGRAREKKCIIVPVLYDGTYKICIELTPVDEDSPYSTKYNYLLKQAKLFANQPVSEDEEALNIVLEWMESCKIKDCSSDLYQKSYRRNDFNEGPGYVQALPDNDYNNEYNEVFI